MATKKTENGKKETAHAKTPTHVGVKTAPNTKKAIEAPDLETMPEEIKTLAATHEPRITELPYSLMSKIMDDVTELMDSFQHFTDNNLTIAQRRRKIGVGIRREQERSAANEVDESYQIESLCSRERSSSFFSLRFCESSS